MFEERRKYSTFAEPALTRSPFPSLNDVRTMISVDEMSSLEEQLQLLSAEQVTIEGDVASYGSDDGVPVRSKSSSYTHRPSVADVDLRGLSTRLDPDALSAALLSNAQVST